MHAIQTIAEMMEISARTAPKAAGKDFVVTKILTKEECERVGHAMIAYGEETGKKNFDRDGNSMISSDAAVLIGLKDAAAVGLNCGACGSATCIKPNSGVAGAEYKGPQCEIRSLDLGIAIGSAVRTAAMMNVDNRVMYRLAVVARRLGLIDADLVMGVPISVSGKNV